MAHSPYDRPAEDRLAGYVRSHAFATGITAALLLWFGFSLSGGGIGSDLFLLACVVIMWTMRVGGVALAIVTLWLATGLRSALLADAVVSVLTGAGLGIGGLMMLGAGAMGLQTGLYLIFGVVFVAAGVRNGRAYLATSGLSAVPPADQPPWIEADPPAVDPRRGMGSARVPASLASQLRARQDQPATGVPGPPTATDEGVSVDETPLSFEVEEAPPAAPPPVAPPPSDMVVTPQEPTSSAEPAADSDDDEREEPPDGFLAGFGDDGPPRST